MPLTSSREGHTMSLDVLVDHPTDDPELVSYIRPELHHLAPELEKVRDCYELLRCEETKGKYLSQEFGEPDEAYSARMARSTYTPVFRDAIRAFAGLLGNYQETELPKTLEENIENVDMMGSSLAKLLNDLDQMVLRDGGAAAGGATRAEGLGHRSRRTRPAVVLPGPHRAGQHHQLAHNHARWP